MTAFTHPRLKDWPARWAEFVKDSLDLQTDLKLDWEHIHCVSFMGQGVEAITGVDPFEAYKDEGMSQMGGCKTLLKHGFKSVDDWIASLFTEIPLSMVRAGDVLLVKPGEYDDEQVKVIMPHAVALADPPFYYGPTFEGLAKGDMFTDAHRAFAVGRLF